LPDNSDKITENIDRRYERTHERKFRTLEAKTPHGSVRSTLYLECSFCERVLSMSLEEQKKVAASFKSPLDFKTINCPCGRSQWILAASNISKQKDYTKAIDITWEGKPKT
jgi:hypothetical protein